MLCNGRDFRLSSPSATTDGLAEWLRDRKNRRAIPHRLERCGYIQVRNADAADGLFKIGGRRQMVYGRDDLSIRDRVEAAARLVRGMEKTGWSV